MNNFARWYRNRYVWVASILAVTAGAVGLVTAGGQVDLETQIADRMRSTLEQAEPAQHNHAGHNAQPGEVTCGVHVYGFEPAKATELADVQKVYGFHLCGVAEQKRPWDVAVKLAGPVILDLATTPPGIQVVEATEDVTYADRLQQMFPEKYAELARTQALTDSEMADVRKRYDSAAGL